MTLRCDNERQWAAKQATKQESEATATNTTAAASYWLKRVKSSICIALPEHRFRSYCIIPLCLLSRSGGFSSQQKSKQIQAI